MSQEELADILNYSFKNISKWENELAIPSYDILTEVAKIFNISINELMEEDLSLRNINKFKTSLIDNKNLNFELQQEFFKFLYTTSTCYLHKKIIIKDNNLYFENYSFLNKLLVILRKEVFDLNKLEFICNFFLNQLRFNGLISFYEITKNVNGNFIDIGYQM